MIGVMFLLVELVSPNNTMYVFFMKWGRQKTAHPLLRVHEVQVGSSKRDIVYLHIALYIPNME